MAESEYSDIIKRLGSKTVVPQPISFGDLAMHDPEHESIKETSIEGSTATVSTENIDIHGYVQKYEYRVVLESNEWRIASLQYIDDEGSYECL